MGKEVVQGIVGGLIAIIICVTIGSFVAQSMIGEHEGGHGEAGAAAEHGEQAAPAEAAPAEGAEKPAEGK